VRGTVCVQCVDGVLRREGNGVCAVC